MNWNKCLSDISSAKAADRRRGCKTLMMLLESDHALQQLETDSSINMGMDDVFMGVNEIVAKEALLLQQKESKTGGSGTRYNNDKVMLRQVIAKIFDVSKERQLFIPVDLLFDTLKRIFCNAYLRENFGGQYYVSILNIIVSQRFYWGKVQWKNWRELVRLSIIVYDDELLNLEKPKVAKTIAYLISLGCTHSNLELWLPSKLEFFESVVNDAETKLSHHRECVMLMAVSFSRAIARENRKILCRFGEKVMNAVLSMYDHTDTEDHLLKNLILEFLDIQLKVHHPCGAHIGALEFCAWDCTEWMNNLEALYFKVSKEINYIHRRSQNRHKEEKILERFSEVVAQVFYQVSKIYEDAFPIECNSDVANPKRQKKELGLPLIMQDLKLRIKEDAAWPWLKVISDAVNQYDDLISPKIYEEFLDLMSELLESSRNSHVITYSFKCCSALAKHPKPDVISKQVFKNIWQKIWAVTLRIIGLNMYEEAAHEMMCRFLVELQEITDFNEVLELYLRRTILPSLTSVKTLSFLLTKSMVIDQLSNSERDILVRWLLEESANPISSLKGYQVDSLAAVFVSLCTEKNIPFINGRENGKVLWDLEIYFQEINFGAGILIPKQKGDCSKDICQETLSLNNTFTLLKDLICESSNKILSKATKLLEKELDSENGYDIPESISYQALLISRISSLLLDLGVVDFEHPHFIGLLNYFEKLMDTLAEMLNNLFMEYSSKCVKMNQILKNLKDLYDMCQSKTLLVYLKQKTPLTVINFLLNLIKDRGENSEGHFKEKQSYVEFIKTTLEPYVPGRMDFFSDYYEITNQQVLKDHNVLKVLACQVLGNFWCCKEESEVLHIQVQIYVHVLKTLQQEHHCNTALYSQMLLGFLSESMKKGAMELKYLKSAVHEFIKIMEQLPDDVEIFKIVLGILGDIMKVNYFAESPYEIVVKNFELCVKKLHADHAKEKWPPSVMIKYVDVVAELTKLDHEYRYKLVESADLENIKNCDLLLQELDSDYLQVRFAVAHHIWPLFYKIRDAKREFVPLLVNWMKYITGSCPEVAEKIEEKCVTNVMCTIHCLIAVAVSTPYLRKLALYYLLKILSDHKIDKVVGHRIFKLLAKSMNIEDPKRLVTEYLPYFLESWILQSRLQEFPFWLVWNNLGEFYSQNEVIIFTFMFLLDHEDLNMFCQSVYKGIPDMLKAYPGTILAFTLEKAFEDPSNPSEHVNAVSYIITELCKINPELTLYQILASKKDSILYNMFRLYYDDEDVKNMNENPLLHQIGLKICRVERSPFCYDKDMIIRSLLHLQNACKESRGFLNYVIDKAPSHVRDVTLRLSKDAISAISPSDSIVALLAFQSFVDRVIELLISVRSGKKRHCYDEIAFGTIRDVCFSYVRLMRKTWWNEDLAVQKVSFVYLKKIVSNFGMECIEGLRKILIPLIGALVDLLEDGVMKSSESEVVDFMLTIMREPSLQESLKLLAPFPKSELFQKLSMIQKEIIKFDKKTQLYEEIKSFLTSYSTYGCCRYESLLHMQCVLRTCKKDLKNLYEELEEKKRYYEEYGNHPLHQLVCMLSKFCKSSDRKISNEAAKCLAELGSCELKTMVLVKEMVPYIEDPDEEMSRNCLYKLTLKCFEIIPKYLRDYDVEVVEAANNTLQSILGSKEGKLTLDKLKKEDWPPQLTLADDFTIEDTCIKRKLDFSLMHFDEDIFVGTQEEWIPAYICSHSEWIVSLVLSLLGCFDKDSSYLEVLQSICTHKVELCEEIFPFLLEILWRNSDYKTHADLCKIIRKFFSASYQAVVENHHILSNETTPMKNKRSIITMLNGVNFLNLQHHGIHKEIGRKKTGKKSSRNAKEQGRSSNYEKSAIDYVHCAVVAQHCCAFFTAIQYCALWINENSDAEGSNMLHYHINANTPGVSEILQVLRESFAGIGDTDALYGCGIGHLFEPEGRIQHFKHLDKWEQVMRSYELEVAYCGQPEKLDGLLKALQMLGMDELLMRFIDAKEMDQYDGIRYECAWRLGAWDQIPTLRKEKSHMLIELMEDSSRKGITAKINEKEIDKLFHQHLFLAVNHIKSGKYKESLDLLDVARSLVIDSLALSSLEACQNLYRPIARLQAIRSTEIFANAFLSKKKGVLPFIIEEWERDDNISQQSFNLAEPVKAVRSTLLEHCCQNTETSSNDASDLNYSNLKALVDIRLQQSIIAREANMFWVSEKYLRAVRQIPNVLTNVNFRLRLGLEEAKLFWSKGDKDVGKIILERLIAGENAEAHYLDYAHALVTYGSWVMDTHSERGKAPLLKYFGKTIELMNDNNHDKHSEDFLHAAKALALFADENFIETKHRIQSSSFQQQKETVLVSKTIGTTYNKIHPATDEKRAASTLLKLADIDQKEISNIENEKASFHCLALFNYIDVLRYSSDKDIDIIYRLVSLMLEPIRDRERIEAKIWCIPTFKFIPVIRQLIPRVIAEDENAKFFKKLIEKCALDHPHHILPALFAVAYSTRGIENIEGSYAFVTEGQKENTTAAQNILGDLMKKEILKDNISQLQKLWESLIDLAYINTPRKSRLDIPRGHSILKLRDLNSVQIPTITLKGSPIAKYKNIVTLHKYEPEFQLVGGINMPKKISCIGSDGVKYFQLLKGKDDPRQDAVMVQVVELINELMVKDKRAQKRNLIMRTYKVVPLSLRSGLIEWCGNTISLGNYLHGDKYDLGAQKKYRPNDYLVIDCKKMMEAVASAPLKLKLQNFNAICEHLKPVFRYYFLFNYQNPCIWYEMTNVYARSVATSSIIGYILGLGDRHLQNILLDTRTSEVIHIDLGIAFEQGRLLKFPETVPFRLTRNIVDGMGVSGVQGVFKKCSEEVMRVIRQHYRSVLTVLEVLIYDPLYAWTLKPFEQALKERREVSYADESYETEDGEKSGFFNSFGKPLKKFPEWKLNQNERNPYAVRALERIERKILGVEDGFPPSSIEAQVDKLIKIAQDPENLCALYSGWQPYL